MDTTAEICYTIKKWFAGQGLSMADAARRLGVTLSAVTNQLNNRKFGRNNADKYAKEFGFSVTYLLTGEGALFPEQAAAQPADSDVRIPRETLEMYTNLTESLRIMAGLVERYAPREMVKGIKGGASLQERTD